MLREEISGLGKKPQLAIVKVGDNSVTEKFLEQKKKFASDIGISAEIYDFPSNISTEQICKEISKIVHAKENTGIVVQLPLPKSVNTQDVLDMIPSEKDPDMLSEKSFGLFSAKASEIFPPVVGAIQYIFMAYGVRLTAKQVVVVGEGRLVGKPVATWLINEGIAVSVVNEHTSSIKRLILDADIIISGAGKPNIITSDMVKDGVVAIDCGTSEVNGRLLGDIDPEVSKKASVFAPVPGGVGPLTVAMLFRNLVELAKTR